MSHHWKLLAATHLAAGLTGYALAPREQLETEVKKQASSQLTPNAFWPPQ